jgi:hypothetical protein
MTPFILLPEQSPVQLSIINLRLPDFFGSVIRLAPVSTKALIFLECFLSKSLSSMSTHECPMQYPMSYYYN